VIVALNADKTTILRHNARLEIGVGANEISIRFVYVIVGLASRGQIENMDSIFDREHNAPHFKIPARVNMTAVIKTQNETLQTRIDQYRIRLHVSISAWMRRVISLIEHRLFEPGAGNKITLKLEYATESAGHNFVLCP